MRLLQTSGDTCWNHLQDLILDVLARLHRGNDQYNVGVQIKEYFPFGGVSLAQDIIQNAKRIASLTHRRCQVDNQLTIEDQLVDKGHVDSIGIALLGACYLAEFGPLPQECYWPDCMCTLKDKCSGK